jgi:hypothetical protein
VTSRIGTAVGAAAIVLVAGAVGYLVATFLFAFSGGQYRMVAVVNAATLIVIALSALIAAVVWLRRSPGAAVGAAAIATGAGWAVALVVVWLISFSLGAG